ncbi:hypothetical protein QVD17_14941 [Tagetes erecta]|uniref:Small auxin up regulated protein n=1 Tax=Tagetes erecta TaxID=13708 RepID=A0AAD8NZ87_TARER|nr:hypothetical protein QVD17_14941 [Tagetes erecta]
MAKVRSNFGNGKKNNGILKRLQKGLFLIRKKPGFLINVGNEEVVPKDVKEGHFAVIASSDYVERRFVVPMAYLSHPSFLRLLERAAEEYGFDHEGALMIPCRPSELECMLKK